MIAGPTHTSRGRARCRSRRRPCRCRTRPSVSYGTSCETFPLHLDAVAVVVHSPPSAFSRTARWLLNPYNSIYSCADLPRKMLPVTHRLPGSCPCAGVGVSVPMRPLRVGDSQMMKGRTLCLLLGLRGSRGGAVGGGGGWPPR